ncbi:MAG TPA: single-stranded-DNA-specific exonuclease RecJ [Thermoanaerobaculia bacterium]|nr:single-stranded-DNA-specific exonuclease RecJ [Thermoanaerobaculia bacterium]
MPIHQSWDLAPDPGGEADLPVSEALIPLFARRGVRDAAQLEGFSRPTLASLHDAAAIGGMDSACERIFRAIRDREAIVIYGDYDVDGVTSIVMLRAVLRALGADVGFVVPHRQFDGYGLRTEVLDRVLRERAIRLVITVDCGITSVEPVARAIEQGIDVIVTDHHLPPDLLPEAAAVLNPRKEGCDYPFKELAGVGVVFKLSCELLRRAGHGMSIESLAKIAAIGTVADVAPLVGENRALVRIGLDGLADPRNPGLRALMRSLGLLGRPLRAADVGFRIGPRINAAGRVASADTAIDLFDAPNEGAALPLVEELHRLNRERRALEAALLREAEEQIAAMGGLPPILVLAGEGWHKGVVGLCAGRLAQKYSRPTLVIARGETECVGSGRSIPSIDLHAELARAGDLFTRFGGHSHACGFSLEASRLDALRERLIDGLAGIDASAFIKRLPIEAEIELDSIDARLLADHALLEPFGQDNPQPALLARGVRVEQTREFSPGCHRLLVRQASRRMTAVCWPSTAALEPLVGGGRTIDLAFRLEPDRYEGFRLEVVDAAAAGEAPLDGPATATDVPDPRPWFDA